MNTFEQIQTTILQLPPEDFRRLSAWLQEIEQERWDEQFAKDVRSGKLDGLAEEAIHDFKAGKCRKL
jgi:hypothetical protein